MSENRYKKYDRSFKLEAVKRSLEPGKTTAEVARELDIKVTQLYKWRDEFDKKESEAFPGIGRRTPDNELEKLRRENQRLREERDILKKSLIFFAREQDNDLNSLNNLNQSFQ